MEDNRGISPVGGEEEFKTFTPEEIEEKFTNYKSPTELQNLTGSATVASFVLLVVACLLFSVMIISLFNQYILH